MDGLDWTAIVKQYHALGLWHATRLLATVNTIRDPSETARDVVQGAWLHLWSKKKFTRALFVTEVFQRALGAIRSSKPIELRIRSGTHNGPTKGKPRKRTTNMFPVQIFGGLIGEVVMDQDVDLSECGGRLK